MDAVEKLDRVQAKRKNMSLDEYRTRRAEHRFGVTPNHYAAWKKLLDTAPLYDHRAVKRALRAYRKKKVSPRFVEAFFTQRREAGACFYHHTDALEAHRLLRLASVPETYATALLAIGLPAANISDSWQSGLPIEYATALAGTP